MPNEPMPASEVLDELDSQWNSSNVTEPNYIEVTGANDPVRFNLNRADYIVGRACLLYTSPSPRDRQKSRMPSSA